MKREIRIQAYSIHMYVTSHLYKAITHARTNHSLTKKGGIKVQQYCPREKR